MIGRRDRMYIATGYPGSFDPRSELGGFVVTFRDLGEVITQGDSMEEALAMAQNALIGALEKRLKAKKPAPLPSPALRGEVVVKLPCVVAAKVALRNEMLATKTRAPHLARALKISNLRARQIIDILQSTRLELLVEAFGAIGLSLELAARRIPPSSSMRPNLDGSKSQ